MARVMRFARVVLGHPSLALPLLRAAWRFRRRDWYRRPPFLPLPPAEYLEWRLETAYGGADRLPDPSELRRYLRWTRWMAGRSAAAGPGRVSDRGLDGDGGATRSTAARPYRVGLTGGVASGKSTVAEIWRRQGARVVDADVLARRAVEPGSPALAEIRAAFGDGVLAPDGSLDRAAMRRRILEDPAARARLEAIVHPEVARLRNEEERRAADAGARVVVHEIPLLFEAGLEDAFDVVVFVDAPRELRVERVTRERGLDRAEAEALADAQLPGDVKRAASDIVIQNTGSLAELEDRATEAWREILRRARA